MKKELHLDHQTDALLESHLVKQRVAGKDHRWGSWMVVCSRWAKQRVEKMELHSDLQLAVLMDFHLVTLKVAGKVGYLGFLMALCSHLVP
mmetsp:Transcript_51263/g.154035  ORF Transcript_51263/g.154035 Transcript_51263/m.154035 type:complete len:90 (-) Transcript_51263:937-1206(-)